MTARGRTRFWALSTGLALVCAAAPAWAQAQVNVPEPGSLGLMAAGLSVLAFYRARNGR